MMKKLTSLLPRLNIITMIYLLLVPGLSMAQLDMILHEIGPGYFPNLIAEDHEGNVLVVSSSNFIGKYNPTLQEYIWSTAIVPAEGSSGVASLSDITVDGSGNSYITGWYTGSLAFGSTILTSLTNSNHIYQKSDLFVTKLDPNGQFLWAKSFGTNAGSDVSNAVALDGAGNIYITGLFCNKICSGPPQGSPPEIEDIYVAKLNNNGTLVWQKRFPPSKVSCDFGGGGHDITVDGGGNSYITGWFQGTFKFGNTTALTLTSQAQGDVFTIKINNSSTALWAKAGKGAGADRGSSLFIDAGGNVNVGGYYGKNGAGDITFAPFTLADVDGNETASGSQSVSNAFLVQYSTAGNINWAINPAPVSGIPQEVRSIIAYPSSSILISMPQVGLKSFSSTGVETSAMLMQDNFTMVGGYPYPKTEIRDLEASSAGYIFSMNSRCGSVPLANILLENLNCSDCANWYDCLSIPDDIFILRSSGSFEENLPIVPRSTPDILGHTYLGTFNGHTYYMSDCPTNWHEANLATMEMGGYLATITSQEEDEFLAPFAPLIECESVLDGIDRIGGAWIGLLTNDNNQDGIFEMESWHNGEEIEYTNWYEFYPEEPFTGFFGMCGIIGYIGGNSLGDCSYTDYRWFTNWFLNATSRYIVEFDQDPGCQQSTKTYVCHNGNTLCINQTSLQNHLDHGDYAGPCSPCNANSMAALPDPTRPDARNDMPLARSSDVVPNIFPNPAKDQIQVDLKQPMKESIITVYSATGERVYVQKFQNESSVSIDVSSLPSGLLLVEVRSGDDVWIKKVMKQ